MSGAREHEQLRVLHVLGSAGVGGVETFLRGLTGKMDRSEFSFSVCIMGREGGLSDYLREFGIPVLCLDSPSFNLQAMQRLHGWVRTHRPAILHTHVGGRRVRWLARVAGCRKVICHVHAPPDEVAEAMQRGDQSLRSMLQHAYGDGSDIVLVCSNSLRASLSAIAPELAGRIRVLHFGIDIDTIAHGPCVRFGIREALDLPIDAPVLGFVGRFVPQKGIDQLFRVACGWLDRERSGRFLAVGDGPLFPILHALDDRFPGRVHLTGQRIDAPALISAMDVMVVTSRWEPFGIVNLEAMAAGIPIIAFDVDGISEVVAHNSTGLLVPRGDSESMVEAVHLLMNSPDRRCSMGHAGRKRVREKFVLRAMVDALSGQYKQLSPYK